MDKQLPNALTEWFTEPVPAPAERRDDSDSSEDPGDASSDDHAALDRELRSATHSPGRAANRRPLIVICSAAIVLWTVVLGLTVVGPRDAAEDEGLEPAGQSTAAVADPVGSAIHDRPLDGVPSRVAATAVVALHERVTAAGGMRWVDAAAIDGVEMLQAPEGTRVPDRWPVDVGETGDAPPTVFVVSLQASLLEGDGAAWNGRRRTRYALPVWCVAGGCRELADPWPLPLHLPGAAPTAAEPTPSASAPPTAAPAAADGTDPGGSTARAAAQAHASGLTAAGYDDIDITAIRPLWPGLTEVQVTASPPGETDPRSLVVWMGEGPLDAAIAPAAANRGPSSGAAQRLLGLTHDSVPANGASSRPPP